MQTGLPGPSWRPGARGQAVGQFVLVREGRRTGHRGVGLRDTGQNPVGVIDSYLKI